MQGNAECLFTGVPVAGFDVHGKLELHGLTRLAHGAAAQHATDHLQVGLERSLASATGAKL